MNYEIDDSIKKRMFSSSLAESLEFKDLEQVINKSKGCFNEVVFIGKDDALVNQNLALVMDRVKKKPSQNLVSKWMKPKGIKLKQFDEFTELEIRSLVKKQSILDSRQIVDLRSNFETFKPRKPGVDKALDNKIHQVIFNEELRESSSSDSSLTDIEELEESNYSISKMSDNLSAVVTPETNNRAKGLNLFSSNLNSVKKSTGAPSHASRAAVGPFQVNKKEEVAEELNAKVREIENIIITSKLGFEIQTSLMNSISGFKNEVSRKLGISSNTPVSVKKENGTETKPRYFSSRKCLDAMRSPQSCKTQLKRAPLVRVNTNFSVKNSKKTMGTRMMSQTSSGKKDNFDFSFLGKHNFSKDMISAFQQ